ncbi:LysR family transcriptional regulator [Cupriavidus consociatus]|uniref:LysR family transcriptional regulator n=1 Tax=Cupriavidus consociatus TaxID=2821357 RepID=UPI001AE9DF2F|nr:MULTISPECIES: LysR family transcriptional regulator [unclassified Cupriavidus]MBP0619195.1 LysR family transcriptional regulator [Cupriavidus sp. LEh25]MDK2655841.1 LysR family transcriptional regulator [Cupriavidus sp. LEh21]
MHPDLNDLYYFAQVVDHQGFAPAGRVLGIPKSKLSRRVAMLEERLGVRLIQRSTRRFSVTELGQTYYAHCKAMLVEAEAAESVIERTRAEPSGLVRMTCPVALLHTRVGEMIADFMAANPKVTVHLEATNRRVDVVAEGVDLAIRVRVPPLDDSDLVMRVLAERAWCIVASPRLVESLPSLFTPADLNTLPTLDLGPPRPTHVWALHGPDGASAELHHKPRLVTDDMIMLRAAAVAGAGLVQLPLMMVSDELREGRLARVLPGWSIKGGVIHAVFPSRRGLLPSVRELIDFLSQRFAQISET